MAELSTLARPYAKAAFEYAAASNELKGWSESLAVIAVVAQQGKVEKLLSSPTYTAEQQAQQLMDVCGESLSEAGRNFISVLAENRRLKLLPYIQQQFEVLKANREKSVDVNVTSAGEITPEQQQKLAAALQAKLDREVNLQVSIDKSLLGGAVIRAGDTVIDGSIRGRLAKLAEALNS